ncbi:MAG: hypothetical protein NT030_08120 [Candidatus Saganbacteria bacterium]|nr:hypothetical protein [Candidatus Saganbacteria bacterium]
MTILLTEIHNHRNPENAFIIFAADQRISRGNQSAGEHKKIFQIPKINAGIGYFGLAEVPTANCPVPMEDWLSTFVGNIAAQESLQSVADNLGNVGDDRETIFIDYQAREDFKRAHASMLKAGQYQTYRNGDIRAHVLAWENMDESLGRLIKAPEFKEFRSPHDYLEWVKFKIGVIADFYEKFCSVSIIGRPVDAFLIASVKE